MDDEVARAESLDGLMDRWQAGSHVSEFSPFDFEMLWRGTELGSLQKWHRRVAMPCQRWTLRQAPQQQQLPAGLAAAATLPNLTDTGVAPHGRSSVSLSSHDPS